MLINLFKKNILTVKLYNCITVKHNTIAISRRIQQATKNVVK